MAGSHRVSCSSTPSPVETDLGRSFLYRPLCFNACALILARGKIMDDTAHHGTERKNTTVLFLLEVSLKYLVEGTAQNQSPDLTGPCPYLIELGVPQIPTSRTVIDVPTATWRMGEKGRERSGERERERRRERKRDENGSFST